MKLKPVQEPAPGQRLVRFCGDTATFSLRLPEAAEGRAWLRTNAGHAELTRREIIREVEQGEPPMSRDWFDVPMERTGRRVFSVTIPLCAAGHFEAKCLFIPMGETAPLWPEGPNSVINVKPAHTVAANTLYNAFVRQFGTNITQNVTGAVSASAEVKNLDQAGFAVIPPSGTFRDLKAHLDFIMGKLGCTVIQLLPVHPTPTTYARMGRFGSPYASLSFTAVDPALARFDPQATPLEQFMELVDAVHARHGRVILDMAIGHTGWAASLHETHPEWLERGPDGRIQAPGAWGVVWEDLTKLDYSHKELWRYMADVFLTWRRRGVDGFRCDAGYMMPVPAWRYITAKVRSEFCDTIFFLEGLGGKIVVTREILNSGGFDWAYSELFQNYDRGAIEYYLPEAGDIAANDGIPVHFAETHDNARLAARGKTWAKMRTALCALSSHNGAFAFANGVEWLATEKIDVHDANCLNWGAPENQVEEIALLNRILSNHPAFFDNAALEFIPDGGGNFLAISRRDEKGGKRVLILVNPDDTRPVSAAWNKARFKADVAYDLLTGKTIDTGSCRLELAGGEVLCLTPDKEDLGVRNLTALSYPSEPERVLRQRMKKTALTVWAHFNPNKGIDPGLAENLAEALAKNPRDFVAARNPESAFPRVVVLRFPRDLKRSVMVPPGHFLLVLADHHFRAAIAGGAKTFKSEVSLPLASGGHFALFSPLADFESHASLTLHLTVFENGAAKAYKAPLLYLASNETARVPRILKRGWLLKNDALLLGTNGKGAMMRAHARWGELKSRYDALLAANLDPEIPKDRRVMLTRVRGWVVFQGNSHEMAATCLDAFAFGYGSRGFWRFTIPTGQGSHVVIIVSARMESGADAISLSFFREGAGGVPGRLEDSEPVRLILRPDVEDRGFHDLTKAYAGAENHFPSSVSARPDGFDFAPTPGHRLSVSMPGGSYYNDHQWQYMVHLPNEAERGQDPDNDLFSPGYFTFDLSGFGQCELLAEALMGERPKAKKAEAASRPVSFPHVQSLGVKDAAFGSMDHYVVDRSGHKSVIAGYPWFLDWGRDSLIFVRGLVAAGEFASAESVLTLFSQFEEKGTLPNCILGEKPGNRDTSDAPLWLFTACADLCRARGDFSLMETMAGKRTVREVLSSIQKNYEKGTPNGVKMDPESGLVWSPPHFSWMDTNHPAATPREGYPIEIQALWFAALDFLQTVSGGKEKSRLGALKKKVAESIKTLFWRSDSGYMADCLHAKKGTPAFRAEADDALRPNQLFAITLGAVADKAMRRKIVEACEELLVPGAIRSLADRPVTRPIPVTRDGVWLNDPYNPYWGQYSGDEDTRRKPAYHNGTAWAWVFPSFCEAFFMAHGETARETALSLLSSSASMIGAGALGHLPEICDGNHPHAPRGCDAQAWSASELYRVFRQIEGKGRAAAGQAPETSHRVGLWG